MKVKNIATSVLTSCALLVGCILPAAADIGWETEEGTLYWEGIAGDNAVFMFLDKNNQLKPSVAIFIEELGKQYSTVGIIPGAYFGTWFEYTGGEDTCGSSQSDPNGKQAPYWGGFRITFKEDYSYFTAELNECGGRETETLNGKP